MGIVLGCGAAAAVALLPLAVPLLLLLALLLLLVPPGSNPGTTNTEDAMQGSCWEVAVCTEDGTASSSSAIHPNEGVERVLLTLARVVSCDTLVP